MKNKFLVLVLLCLAVGGLAQTPPAADEQTMVLQDAAPAAAASQNTSVVWYIIRMFLVLGLVLLSIYGLYVFLKRRAKRAMVEDPFIKNLGSTQIAPGKSVHVLSLGAKAWLVGVSDSAITMLAELEDKELIDAMVQKSQEAPQEPPQADFRSVFLRMFPGVAKKPEAPKLDIFSEHRNRIKKL